MLNDAISELYNDKRFISVCIKYGNDNFEELRSEVVSILLEMPKEKLSHIIESNYLLPYSIQVARFQSIDDRSTFNRGVRIKNTIPLTKISKVNNTFLVLLKNPYEKNDDFVVDYFEQIPCDPFQEIDDLIEKENRLKLDIKLIEKIKKDANDQSSKYFYQANIAISKPKYGSIRKLSQKVGIDYRTMQIALNKYLEHLKEWQKK